MALMSLRPHTDNAVMMTNRTDSVMCEWSMSHTNIHIYIFVCNSTAG